ncbi:unnamed protein product [Amaranthus hypochondriacus]
MEGLANPVSTAKTIMIIIMSAILFRCVSAVSVNHTVGGSSGWSLSSNLSLWSASKSFFVNDSLVFSYTPDYDVIELSKSDFDTCRINSPISTHDDESGQTVILLSQPGWRYFVCGRPHHCNMGLKLSVHVQDHPTTKNPNEDEDQPFNTGTTSVNGNTVSGPHKSLGFSYFNAVTSGTFLLQLSITFLGILCIFCFL